MNFNAICDDRLRRFNAINLIEVLRAFSYRRVKLKVVAKVETEVEAFLVEFLFKIFSHLHK